MEINKVQLRGQLNIGLYSFQLDALVILTYTVRQTLSYPQRLFIVSYITVATATENDVNR